MIARVHHVNGRGTVQSLHGTLQEALDTTPRDQDGCAKANTCYWKVPAGVKVGDMVTLGGRS